MLASGLHCSAFLRIRLPSRNAQSPRFYSVEHDHPFVQSSSLRDKCIRKRLASPCAMQSMGFSSPWIPHGSRYVHVSAYASNFTSICFPSSVQFEEGMFEHNVYVKTTEGSEDKTPNDEEEDLGLIPQAWRPLQVNLHKTKIEKKIDMRLQQIEDAMRKASELQLKRKKLVDTSMSFNENNEDERGLASMSHPFIEPNLARPEELAELEGKEQEGSWQNRHTGRKKSFDSELGQLFTEDEIACVKRHSPDLTKICCKKWPPLHALVASGQFFLLDEFLKSVADVNFLDEDGFTPIHRAVLGRKETAVMQLVRAGAHVNVHDKDGASYLHYSVQTGSLNLVRLFVKYGVDMDHPDKDGWTPLHVAVLTGREDIVRHLLISGADKHTKTKDGHTALDICLALGKGYKAYAVAKSLKQLPKEGLPTDAEIDTIESQGS